MNVIETKKMMLLVANGMVDKEPILTKFDQAIGDGDHGIGIERGFSHVSAYIEEDFDAADVGDVMLKIGTKLMSTMGGASGAIFGTLFRTGGKAILGEKELTTDVLAVFLNAGLEGIYKRGGAAIGAKTMIDALVPAMESAKALSGQPLAEALIVIQKSAHDGVENTKSMIATTGKAKTLGERSLGHPDPGAMSMAYIMEFMSDYAQSKVEA